MIYNVTKNSLHNSVIEFINDFGIIPKGTIGYCHAIENGVAYIWLKEPILNMNNFNFKVDELIKYIKTK